MVFFNLLEVHYSFGFVCATPEEGKNCKCVQQE
jgi:hypothetical protein